MKTFPPVSRRRPALAGRRHRARLLLESLEDRTLLNGTADFPWSPEGDDDLINRDYIEANQPPFNDNALVQDGHGGVGRDRGGPVSSPPGAVDVLTNDNTGSNGTSGFTQSETSLVAYGSTVVLGFNDSGSHNAASNKFTGFSRSTNAGASFSDGGVLPTSTNGDAGDPVMARNDATGRIYLATLVWSGSGLNVFHSDDGAGSWSAPAQSAPGKGGSQDKEWIAVDNFAGTGQGNVYEVERDFGTGNGIYAFRSTDNGATFGPSNGTLIASGAAGNVQGAFVTVGPDHAVYVFYFDNTTATQAIKVCKSTDLGVTFGAPVTVTTLGLTGTNGDQGLVGVRNGTTATAAFRSSAFPHAAVNPVNGNLYVTYANKGAGTDKADIFFRMSTDGGATWSAATRVNSDATSTDQWQPTIVAATDGSRVGVFYYSRQEDTTGNNLFKYYGSLGIVSGSTVTFQPNFAISTVASLPEFGRDSLVNSTYMGDYNQAVATPGYFHVSWADNRSDLPNGAPRKDPSVYYDKIPLGLVVASTSPAADSIVSASPTSYVINFSDAVNTANVLAGVFRVNNTPADGLSWNTAHTQATFTFSTDPVAAQGQGVQAMALPANAITRQSDGAGVVAFNAVFRYDVTPLTVLATDPAANSTIPLAGTLRYTVNFQDDNPILAGSVDVGDLTLNMGSVLDATLTGDYQATYTIGGLTAEGTLNVAIAAGALTDSFGNPNSAFAGSYNLDFSTVGFPVSLQPKAPLGSLIYESSTPAFISPADDSDSFTISVNAGQTITVLVTPAAALQPSISVAPSGGPVIGSAIAPAAGKRALLETVPAVAGGSYTITVGGAAGSGSYTVQVILNAALEAESNDGGTNNSLLTAQDINASFVTVATSVTSAQRGAVLGQTDQVTYSAAAVTPAFEDISSSGTKQLQGVDDGTATVSIPFAFPFYRSSYTSVSLSSNGLITFDGGNASSANSDLGSSPPQAAIAPYWDNLIVTAKPTSKAAIFTKVVGTGSSQHLVIQWNNISYAADSTKNGGLTFEAILSPDGSIKFNYKTLSTGRNGGLSDEGKSATVGIKEVGTVQGADRVLVLYNGSSTSLVGSNKSVLITRAPLVPDLYSFALAAGDTASLALKLLTVGTANVELLDSSGNPVPVTTPASPTTNLDKVISSGPVATTGTYFARVSGGSNVKYSLVAARNATIDAESNDTFATAQDMTGQHGAIGYVRGNNVLPIETFEGGSGELSSYTFTGANNASVTTAARHDGTYGLQLGSTTEWMYRNDGIVHVQQGDTISVFVQAAGDPTGRAYFGFGSSATGTLSIVLAGNSGQLLLQNNAGYGYTDLASAPQAWLANHWYRLEISWQVGGTIVGRLFDSDGTSLLNTVTATDNTITSGGLSFRGFGPTYDFDTVQTGGFTNEDWYKVTLGSAQTTLHVETSTPSDGLGEFGNTLNPHIELYSPSNVLISAATATVLGDGRNEVIDATGLTPGATYRIRIVGEAGTSGEYFLDPPPPPAVASAVASSPSDPGKEDAPAVRINAIAVAAVPPITTSAGLSVPSGPSSVLDIAVSQGTPAPGSVFSKSPRRPASPRKSAEQRGKALVNVTTDRLPSADKAASIASAPGAGDDPQESTITPGAVPAGPAVGYSRRRRLTQAPRDSIRDTTAGR